MYFLSCRLLLLIVEVGEGIEAHNNNIIIVRERSKPVKHKGLAALPEWEEHFTVARSETSSAGVVAPVFSGRACRYCGGPTVEAPPAVRVVGWSVRGIVESPHTEVVRRRYWCDGCEKVTS